MSKTTRRAAQSLPKLALLMLCLCIGSLVAHVAADGLKQPGYSLTALDLNHHHLNDGDDHEESLCVPDPDGVQSSLPIDPFGLSAQPMDLSRAILPLIPPPKA